MDNIKIGQFIANKRKHKGMTQQELADVLCVTNKAISKWETGSGIPDISILQDLAKALGVTIDELLNGEDNATFFESVEKDYQSVTVDKNMFTQFMKNFYFQRVNLLFGITILGSLLLTGGYALIGMNRYIGKHIDIIGMLLMAVGIVFLFLPIILRKIKCITFQSREDQYICEQDGIVYRKMGDESKYFYRDIQRIIEGENIVILQCGKQFLWIKELDYKMIKKYIKCPSVEMISSYQRNKVKVTIFLLVVFIQLICLELGYTFILKRYGFEYFYDAFEVVVIVIIFISAIMLILINKIHFTKSQSLMALFVSVIVVGVAYIAANSFAIKHTIYSISPDLSSQLVLKQNKESGEMKYFHYTFLCFAVKTDEMSTNKDLDIKTQWLTGDCNLVTYRNNQNEQKAFVATYGERGNGISYYNVVGSMNGNWVSYNEHDQKYNLTVENGSITVETNNVKEVFSPQEIQQNGTIAITLFKGSKAKYVIAMDKNCTLNENYLIKNDGHIQIVSVGKQDKSSVELFCTTHKEDTETQMNIEEQKREDVTKIIENMQKTIQDNPTLKNYKSSYDLLSISTDSTDYFEVTKMAYLASVQLAEEYKEEGQITNISVKAGNIQDFYVEVESKITIENLNSGEKSESIMVPHYRIMKADGGYLIARISPILSGNIGLATLASPIEKDVSQDSLYHYTK